MSDKVQTSLWLSKDLKHIVDNEDLNLSRWVSEMLEKYFSVSTIEDVNKEMDLLKAKMMTLEKRRADMIARGADTTTHEAIAKNAMDDLKEKYKARRQNGIREDFDRDWISSPKNLARVRAAGWQIDEALFKLKEWYDGVQKHNDS